MAKTIEREKEKYTVTEIIDTIGVNKFTIATLVLCAIAIIFDGLNTQTGIYVVSSMQAQWGLTTAATGGLVTYQLAGFFVGGMVVGPLSDKYGRKVALIVSVAFFGAMSLINYFATSYTYFAIVRFLTGCGLGAATPMILLMCAEWMPSKFFHITITCGQALMITGNTLAGVLTDKFCEAAMCAKVNAGELAANLTVQQPFISGMDIDAWRMVFAVCAIALLWAIVLLLTLTESPQFYAAHGDRANALRVLRKYEQRGTGATALTGSLTEKDLLIDVKKKEAKVSPKILLSKKYLGVTIAVFGCNMVGVFVMYAQSSYLPKVVAAMGFGYTSASITFASGIIANITAGYFAGKFNGKNSFVAFLVNTIMIVVVWACCTNNLAYGILMIPIIIFGFTMNYACTSVIPLMASSYAPEIRGTSLGWCQAFGRLAGAISPVVMGALVDSFMAGGNTNLEALLTCFIILAVLSLIAALFMIRYKQPDYEEKGAGIVGAEA